ncbi:PucR family transcriptional regulator ligand-binding domain-containing protein, partial [Halalkalibacter okhensis]
MKLNQLMEIGGLKKCKIVAGLGGVQNNVDVVTVMEVPDIIKWLSGNELILTSLYSIKDDSMAQANLIKLLYNVGASAIAIKTNRYVPEIPKSMRRESEKYRLPIIEIPEQITYAEILHPAMNAIFHQEIDIDMAQDNRGILERSFSGGVKQILATLASIVEHRVYLDILVPYINEKYQQNDIELLSEYQVKKLENYKNTMTIMRKIDGEYKNFIITPIFVEQELCGTISCFGIEADSFSKIVDMERASKLISLLSHKNKATYDVHQTYKNDFLRDLFLNNSLVAHDLIEKGRLFKYKHNIEYSCIVIKFKQDTVNKSIMNFIETILKRVDPDAIAGIIRGAIYVLLTDSEIDLKLNKLIACIDKQLKEYKIGVGRAHKGIEGVRKSFRECEQAVKFDNYSSIGSYFHYNDIGVYKLFSLVEDKDELMKFYLDTLGKLDDSKSDLNLIDT